MLVISLSNVSLCSYNLEASKIIVFLRSEDAAVISVAEVVEDTLHNKCSVYCTCNSYFFSYILKIAVLTSEMDVNKTSSTCLGSILNLYVELKNA